MQHIAFTSHETKAPSSVKGVIRSLILAAVILAVVAMARVARGQDVPATQPQTTASPAPTAQIVSEGLDAGGRLVMPLNNTRILKTRVAYKRLSIGQPDVADVNPIGTSDILVTAHKVGATQLIIWDDADRSQTVDVTVVEPQGLEEQLAGMFPGSKIQVSSLNGAIVLRGRVPSLQTAEQAVAVATPYAQKVLNFLEVSGGQQVMLQVRFAEVSRSASNELGFNFAFGDGITTFASNIGAPNTFQPTTPLGGIERAIPGNTTLFGSGRVGATTFEYFLRALRENNLMRMLAEPNLITTSGQEASFLAGGEFPVPVTQGGGSGGVAVTVEYREFGVKLKMTPVVLGDGRMRIKVAPEVSDLDFTTAVRLNGFVIPGLTSRKVETSIELAEGQTFAIAGLLNNSITSQKDVTPLLGDMPVIGPLFRSVRYQRKETELVVLVTPRLVSPMNPDQVPLLPGEKWRSPSELDLLLNQDIGGEETSVRDGRGATTQPATAHHAPERFRGEYGFVPSTQPAASSER